ncbi:DNA polymerase III subunit alpha [bacterium (Candidatus Gribaldobacteria) CG_4_10_14_0_8_um_filter_33_9]|uniref:DNA polymerase III subunit alpha n=1 Tax=bacterium (Candidatus Gribaldobacteria) CG_4_10_14_0_8_um_filter_33_9 TaxID=2014266 RepID=A0A2M7RP47_9BACT|nr:MAG: DNA polymerase III subunit alpha [bacterium (Candidatus Gribaldobacteria) CG_4_10_14_0_8_um_filter_33_9]
MSLFTHLHVHSHYSLLDGLPKIDELLDRVQELGMDACALTDHGVLYGGVEFYKKAKKRGIKPILGCEFYLAQERMYQKRANIDDLKYHLVLLVKNQEGYKNLIKLITQAHLEGFYYKPRIDEELLIQHSSGLIALSACLRGKIPYLISAGKIEEAKKQALKYQEIFGQEGFYLEIQSHPNLKDQTKVNKVLIDFSKELNIPLIATNDTHYLKSEDAEAQDILMLINTGAKIDNPERLTMKANDFSFKTQEEMIDAFKDVPSAIENTQKIAALCDFQFELNQIKLPVFETPNNKAPDEYLKELCYQGLENEKKKIEDKVQAQKRLDYELSVIKQTGFASYLLIVHDFVKWAKENRIIVGPGRGSAGGSLAVYLLDITDVNPLKYNLLFERFLNPERISMPDIDLDFTDRRRDEVIDYVAQKYGREKVAQIITFGKMTARAVIRDVGRAMQLNYNLCDKIAKTIPFGLTLDEALKKVSELRQLYETDQTIKVLIDFSKKLEGCARHASVHACGVVISDKPLDEIVPLQYPTQNDTAITTQYDMYSVEEIGLLKMDFLGLKNLTIIEDTIARIYKTQDKKIKLDEIPFDDKKTYKLLQEGKTISVFQLEADAVQGFLKELKPNDFEDIIVINALNRPGPMAFISEYIQRKHKKKRIEYLHPKLKPILEYTQGICIFQEQIMQIARDLAGFSLSDADVLRKAVGKKIKDLLIAQKEKFINGAINNGIKKEIIDKIWELILPFSQYGFCRAHSTAYAMIAFQTAYLKAHFPVEFMAAALTSEKNNIEKIAFLIDECKNMGIEVLAPDINESFRNFSVVPGKNKIRFGLLAIKNVGSNIVSAIIEEKEKGVFKSFSDFISRIDSKDLNKKSLESLIKTGVFDKFEERGKLLENLEQVLKFNRDIRKINNSNQKSLFEESATDFSFSFKLKETKPALPDQTLLWEKELLGLYISSHPLEKFKKVLARKTLPLKELKEHIFNQNIRVGGLISSIKKILTKKGEPMLFIKLEDLTGKVEVIVFPGLFERSSAFLQENKIVFIIGKIDNYKDAPKIIAEQIEEIIESD